MKMTRNLKIKIAAIIVAALASIVVMGVLLFNMQNALTQSNYASEMIAEAEQLDTLLADAASEADQNKETFDAIYQSKAQSIAFMANNNTGYEATDAKMREYQELLGVDNVLIVKRDGSVVACAQKTEADFSHARFNYLRESLSTGEPSRAVEIDLPDREWLYRYYAAKIDNDTMAVIEQSPVELDELDAATSSTASVLRNITVGQDGYVFALSAQTYLIEYHPDENLVGADAIDAGIEVAKLEDGTTSWMTLNGDSLYCHVSLIDDMYYIQAVPASDMNASTMVTVGVILFAFTAVVAAVALYGIFVLRDDERRGETEQDGSKAGGLRINRRIAKKAAVLSAVGFIGIIVISFYMQTLFALSSQSLTMTERVEQIAQTIKTSQDRASDLEDQYNERYLSKAQVAAYILDRNPELAMREKLQELADALQIQYLFKFDSSGRVTATNSTFTNFVLSEDPADQSYEFRKLLQGVESYVQPAGPDEVSGELRQYIGVVTHNADGIIDGFVQLGIRPTRLESLLESVQIDHVLDGVHVGADGFAFAIDKSDGTFAYYPDANTVGKAATACGMTENQLVDGYSDYITVNGEQYFAASAETSDYYVYAVGSDGALMAERVPLTIATAGIALVCLAVIFCLMVVEPKPGADQAVASARKESDDDPRMVDVTVGGRTMKTESAASRWLNRAFSWDEMTPEQKLGTVLRWLMGVAVILVCLAVIFKDAIFGTDSIFAYILGGSWQHGPNIFAITASLMSACVIMTVATILQKIFMLIAQVVEARGVTMCRLAASIVKYAAMIGMLYWCLALLGVDTATLLASAGLLTLAISLGAKDLVADIIAGLFIIFEGEFRVGDIIQVGGSKGTVMEIGVRTTKINDGSGNILVLRNSGISNVVNMTKEHSFAAVEVGIEYGESLERVENILSKELPNIRKRLPAIIDGPFYRGVTMLADNSVNIKIVAECNEKDRGGLTNDLNREMKLLFDKYGISIPFPQVVVNQPTVFKKATAAEKRAADAFNAEQKEAFKNFVDENEDFDEFNDSHRH